MRLFKIKSNDGPVWINENTRGAIKNEDIDKIDNGHAQYPEEFKIIDSNTIEINGVKYQKVEELKPQTLLDIIREWNDDDDNPPCEVLVDMIADWLPNSYQSYSIHNEGWNECLNSIRERLK